MIIYRWLFFLGGVTGSVCGERGDVKAVKQSIPRKNQLVRPLRGRIIRKKDGETNHIKRSLKEDKKKKKKTRE